VTDRRGEGRFSCGKELIEKHRANWPATGCNNMLSTHELWGDPALAMDSFHFTCYLCPFPPLYKRIYVHIASLYLSQKHVLEKG